MAERPDDRFLEKLLRNCVATYIIFKDAPQESREVCFNIFKENFKKLSQEIENAPAKITKIEKMEFAGDMGKKIKAQILGVLEAHGNIDNKLWSLSREPLESKVALERPRRTMVLHQFQQHETPTIAKSGGKIDEIINKQNLLEIDTLFQNLDQLNKKLNKSKPGKETDNTLLEIKEHLNNLYKFLQAHSPEIELQKIQSYFDIINHKELDYMTKPKIPGTSTATEASVQPLLDFLVKEINKKLEKMLPPSPEGPRV